MLLHLPVGLSSRQTAHRRHSGAHNDRSQSHRQWLAVTAPAGRAYAVERVRLTCRREPRCCQTKQVPKKGVEGRRREARRRPKKLRFISRGQKALAHPSLLPLSRGMRRGPVGGCGRAGRGARPPRGQCRQTHRARERRQRARSNGPWPEHHIFILQRGSLGPVV